MLYLGRRHSAYVNGLSIEESDALLNALWAHATDPRFCYTHEWAVGDVVVWDNQATLHRRDAFDSSARRAQLPIRSSITGTACRGRPPVTN